MIFWNVCFKQPCFFSLLGPRLPKRAGVPRKSRHRSPDLRLLDTGMEVKRRASGAPSNVFSGEAPWMFPKKWWVLPPHHPFFSGGFSIINTIHFGVYTPIFGNIHMVEVFVPPEDKWLEHNSLEVLWKIIFLSKWVICRWTMFIFQGVPWYRELLSISHRKRMPENHPLKSAKIKRDMILIYMLVPWSVRRDYIWNQPCPPSVFQWQGPRCFWGIPSPPLLKNIISHPAGDWHPGCEVDPNYI